MSQLFDLTGRVSIITGASSGLGVEFARALSSAGSAVVLAARRTDRLTEVAERLQASGASVLSHTTDVTDPEACQALATAAMNEYGRVDVLVNNAGLGPAVTALKETPEHFRGTVDVNLNATYWMAQACAKLMQPGSSIVNVASVHGLLASLMPQAGYAATKSAVIGLTRDLAMEWSARRGIRVNALAPGYFASEMTDMGRDALEEMVAGHSILGRFGRPEELDGAIVFLASDASSYMTGATLVIDGGMSATV